MYTALYVLYIICLPPVFRAVASLLNPCQCDDVWNCGCRTVQEAPQSNGEFASVTSTFFSPDGDNSASSGGLETLARAVVLFSSPLTPRSPANHLTEIPNEDASTSPVPLSCQCQPVTPLSPRSSPTPVLDLPPLLFPEIPGPTPVVPPFSTFTTLAGSGCTCGLTCQCPDCVSHRPGVESRNAQDCMNCVDQSLRVIDRSSSSGFHVKSPVLEKFLADAKRVPPPPTLGGKPVELPKLCCGGSCGCGGACGCDGDCNGCCRDIEREGSKDLPTDAVAATGVLL